MRITLTFILFPFLLFACLKNIEEADALYSNIFDRDYAGEQWYDIKKVSKFTNLDGQIRIKLETYIQKERFGNLKPSQIDVQIQGDGIAQTILTFTLQPSGDYRNDIELKYDDTLIEYCITLGLYIKEEKSAINLFTTCVVY